MTNAVVESLKSMRAAAANNLARYCSAKEPDEAAIRAAIQMVEDFNKHIAKYEGKQDA